MATPGRGPGPRRRAWAWLAALAAAAAEAWARAACGPVVLSFRPGLMDGVKFTGAFACDGVDLAVRVADGKGLKTTVWEHHLSGAGWADKQVVDLSAWAGKDIKLELEVSPGAARDAR